MSSIATVFDFQNIRKKMKNSKRRSGLSEYLEAILLGKAYEEISEPNLQSAAYLQLLADNNIFCLIDTSLNSPRLVHAEPS